MPFSGCDEADCVPFESRVIRCHHHNQPNQLAYSEALSVNSFEN